MMTERFLLHCFDDSAHPNDLQNIYALALAYQPNPNLLQAIFQSENLENALIDLERRHSFVFLSQMKLHSSVQAFLREYLLHPLYRNSIIVRSIHQRAIGYFKDTLSEIETQHSVLEARTTNGSHKWTMKTLVKALYTGWKKAVTRTFDWI